jgi:hypothetical protein
MNIMVTKKTNPIRLGRSSFHGHKYSGSPSVGKVRLRKSER